MKRIIGLIAAAIISSTTFSLSAEAQSAGVRAVQGWEAVGRLNIAGRNMCTGSLIAPNLVLTAAHCLYNPQTGQAVNPRSIKFEAGLNGRRAKASRRVVKAVVHPGYRHNWSSRSEAGSDIAVLRLDRPIAGSQIRPFVLAAAPTPGDSVDVLSYTVNQATRPAREQGCRILSTRSETLVTSCRVEYGASGSPVLQMRKGGAPLLVSVISAKAQIGRKRVSLATTFDGSLRSLMRRAG
ncbi:S1 family peptidase [Phaeobacter inhibens]|uniref:Trypsin-like protein n=1 Tax=Phaeobacter inhibens TaxID=221822 RepID=A0A135ILM6_9RHOB|nr:MULTISPECIES: trypsin-like serine protease [Phaeobacter]AFO88249.1 trypsin-like protein [Phaeobacter inhibens 2.10]AFO92144.1 trypsin-like protein [Phaeobacter inhibens DSM 17395]APX15378.1 trypsin [Phaeobacter inhibens]AUQ46829.1 trypsin-like protein [Phaeobacter inhibens]AUQ49203.1 trypsin-like protein [Phaeobacter inhibens]